MLIASFLVSAIAGYVFDLVKRDDRKPVPRRRKTPRQPIALAPAAGPSIVKPDEPLAETAQNHTLFLRTGAATLACVALSPVIPAVMLAAPAIAVVGTMPFIRSAVAHWRAKRSANDEAVSVLTLAGVILALDFLAVGLMMMLWWVRQRLYIATKDRSRREITELFGKRVSNAWLIVDGTETEVPVGQLRAGDIIAVHAGDTIPVDGIVIDGAGRADQRMLTGEEWLAELAPDSQAFAATHLLSGRLTIRVERAGAETTAGRIVDLLNRTTEYRLSTELRAKRIADSLAPYYFAIGVAAIPLVGLYRAACFLMVLPGPWSLMVAVPLGMLHTLSRAGRRGIAIMDGRTLEMLPNVNTVVFDKTGTLTEKVPELGGIHCAPDVEPDDLLRWAAAAEHRQNHPIAHAIRAAAAERVLAVPIPDDADYRISNGIQARIEGSTIHIGSARFMAAMAVALPTDAIGVEQTCHANGHMAVHVARDGRHIGVLSLRTRIREEAREVVAALQAKGINVRILSGDGQAQTAAVAHALGVTDFDAEVLPHEKSAVIRRLREEGRFVCFVGDGINDVVAMREAQVSVAVAGATEAATAVAGVIIYDDDLRHVLDLLRIGTMFRERTNTSILVSTLPTIPGMAAALFFGAGMLTSLAVFYLTIIAGAAAFIRPWPGALRDRPTGDERRGTEHRATPLLTYKEPKRSSGKSPSPVP